MRKLAFTLLILFTVRSLIAQTERPSIERQIEIESAVVTTHETTIKGKKVSYKATTGTQPVWNEKGKPVASLFYTYYERTDISDKTTRPLVLSFNGGPGSASIWMHIAYTGPVVLNIDDEGYPLQPYGTKSNPYSILDVADIVYIDPVNTGYSRIVDEEVDRSTFFGINSDIRYLADWVNTFVTRQNRWASPKYLIGESYGTTRVAGLVAQLQNSHWMYFNGVIMVSPTELGIERGAPIHTSNYLPYYAATAWYHEALDASLQSQDLADFLPEVEAFTINELIPAVVKGGTLSTAERDAIATKYALYSGLSKEVVLEHNLLIPTNFFWKELLRDEGMTIGRLDSRYKGFDNAGTGSRPDFDPALSSWNHAFAPSFQIYVRENLNFKTDLTYNLFGPVHPWDRSNESTGYDLGDAMRQNPYLHLMVQSGYYDGGTDFFNAKYNLWQIDAAGRMSDRISWKGYRSGHMMYLRAEDLETSNEDIREFIKNSMVAPDMPAKYN